MIRSRRGISTYLSWVMVFAFMIFVSTLMYQIMIGQVETQTDNLEKRVDESSCEDVGITINSYCQDEYSILVNITNSKTKSIEGLTLTLFDIYDEPFQVSKNVSIDVGEQEEIEILKHGTLIQAEMVPDIGKDDKRISCLSSKLTLNNIDFCS